MAKEFFYPVRDADDPGVVRLVPVPEEIYRPINREISCIRKRMQRSGRCVCPENKLWACDAHCGVCPFSACGDTVSIDTLVNDSEDLTLEDTFVSEAPSMEETFMEEELIRALHEELEKLDPASRRICELIASGNSERKAASILGVSDTAFRYRWGKIKRRLAEKLKDTL